MLIIVNYLISEFSFDDYFVDDLKRSINPHPFVPKDGKTRDERCKEIFTIQSLWDGQQVFLLMLQQALLLL